MHLNSATKSRLPLASLVMPVMLWLGSGCGVAPGIENATEDDLSVEDEEAVLLGVAQQPLVVPDPNGTYFAEVTANGTGCPAGTWETAISEDGKTFTTTFSSYEAMIEPNRTIAIKDCQLGIKLHSPQGLSFAVDSFYYQGYAYLDTGVTGRQTANYYFMGNPLNHAELRTDLRGPYDDDYLFQDDVGILDLVWSPCGVERNLNVTTRLRVQNNSRRTGTGYMNLLSVDGEARLVFSLAWRHC
jgi:hypothetical protein